MNHAAGDIGNVAGALIPFLTPALLVAIATLLGFILRHHVALKRLKIDADVVEIDAHRVENADEADIRDHYADEVRQLRQRLDDQASRHRQTITDVEDRARKIVNEIEERAKKAIEDSDRRHEECENARRQMRLDLDELREEIRGLRTNLAQRSDSVIHLFPTPSPEIEDAARRASDATARLAADAADKPRQERKEPKQ